VIARLALIATCAFSGAAFAQGAPAGAPPGPMRLAGTVTAIDGSVVTLKADDGTETRLVMGSGLNLMAARPAEREEIKPGSLVATAARTQPDGTGRSYGFRLIAPGSPTLGSGRGPMPESGTTITNGTVTKVTKSAAGHEIDIAYDGGTRHVLLPPDIPVVSSFPADRTLLKVGVPVNALAARGLDGTVSALMIMVMLPGSQGTQTDAARR